MLILFGQFTKLQVVYQSEKSMLECEIVRAKIKASEVDFEEVEM